LVPRMSRTQRNAIVSPATGLMIFQDTPDSVGFYYYNGSAWTWILANSNADSLAWRTGGNTGTNPATKFIGTTDNVPLVIKTNNNPSMYLSTNRAIGIGTTVPGTGPGLWAKLDIRDEDGSASDVALTVAGGGYPVYNLIKQRGTLAAPATVLANDLLGEVNGQMYNGTGYYKAANILLQTDGTVAGDAPGRIRFNTTPAGSLLLLERMTIRANGNVGIGVALPTVLLDVNGNNGGTNSLQLRSGNNAGSFLSNQVLFGWAGTDSYRHAIKTRHNSGPTTDNSIDFYVWNQGVDASTAIGTKRVMTIDGNYKGMVGIGTSTPRSELHITDGSASLKNVTDAGNYGASLLITDNNIPRIYFEDAGQPTDKKLMGITSLGQNLSIGSLNDVGNTWDKQNILVANRDGKVGINMIPVNTLDVTGTTRFNGDFINQGAEGIHASAVQNVPFTNGVFNALNGTVTSITITDGFGVNNSAVFISAHARTFGGNLLGGTSSLGGYFMILQRDNNPAFTTAVNLTYTSDICYIRTPNGVSSASIGFGGGGHISYLDQSLAPGTYYYRLVLYPNGVGITSGTYDVYERDVSVIQIKR
ncbi:MAG: hypothetical protein ABIN74_13405, partial [Ferruginibacter sp.]